jgi:HlyD family secretion protein
MEMYTISEDNSDLSSIVLITEEDIFVELPETSVEAELFKERFLIEKQEELAMKNTEIETVQSQLEELRVTGDTITFDSPYEGKIKHISQELMDPIVLIQGSDLEIIGQLHEGERLEVEEGMPAALDLYETDDVLESSIAEMADTPEDTKANKTSVYPFTALLPEEGTEELLPGLSGLLTIILEERNGITAVNEEGLIDQAVWKMNAHGQLQRTPVETGFSERGAIEVQGEIEAGVLLAKDPEDNLLDEATFITPIIWEQLLQGTEAETTVDWKKPFFSGLISR